MKNLINTKQSTILAMLIQIIMNCFKNSDLNNIKSGFFDNLELLKDKNFFSNNRDLFYLLIHFLNTVVHDLFMICNNHKDIYNFSYLKTLTKWSKNLN